MTFRRQHWLGECASVTLYVLCLSCLLSRRRTEHHGRGLEFVPDIWYVTSSYFIFFVLETKNKPKHVDGVAVTLQVLCSGNFWFKSRPVADYCMVFPWLFFCPHANAVKIHLLRHNCFFSDHFEFIIHELVCIQRCRVSQ